MIGLKRWRRRRLLRHARLPPGQWETVVAGLPLLAGLTDGELDRLRDLAVVFLHEKSLEAVGELEVDATLRLAIAAQACLPVLNLGLDYYRGWHAVVIYPAGFLTRHEYTDAAGVVHAVHRPLVGEAWEQGPVILSLEDIEDAPELDGFNVVLHEFAHKLDMLNGEANGLPPLHCDMSVAAWARDLSAAYEDLCRRVDADRDTAIDPYAAESPEEFFAVVSEVFFEVPKLLASAYPAVYAQLGRFYRQDPRARLG